jgi:hypothetical protein
LVCTLCRFPLRFVSVGLQVICKALGGIDVRSIHHFVGHFLLPCPCNLGDIWEWPGKAALCRPTCFHIMRNTYGFVPLSDGAAGAAAGGVAGVIGSGAGCVIGGFVDAVVAGSVPVEPPHSIQAKAATRITAATAIHVPHMLPRRVTGGVVRRSGSLLGS